MPDASDEGGVAGAAALAGGAYYFIGPSDKKKDGNGWKKPVSNKHPQDFTLWRLRKMKDPKAAPP